MAEILICAAIALIIMLGLGILIKLLLWLDENTNLDFGVMLTFVVTFIGMTIIVWVIRTGIKETDKAKKLERRRI